MLHHCGMDKFEFLPTEIVGGESIWIAAANTYQDKTDITITDFTPAGGWALKYNFEASTPFTVTATANGGNTGWTLQVTGVQTLTMQPGVVNYTGIVSQTISEVEQSFAVDVGSILVKASPMRVSSWVAVLAAVDAAITTFAANPNGSISVDGMSVSYRGMDDLMKLRDYVNYRLKLDSATRQKRIIRARFT